MSVTIRLIIQYKDGEKDDKIIDVSIQRFETIPFQ